MTAQKESWQRKLRAAFMGYLRIFAGEDRFIHGHRNKETMIKEQQRYGNTKQK